MNVQMEMANAKMVDVSIHLVLIFVNVMKDSGKIPDIYVEVSTICVRVYLLFIYPICLLMLFRFTVSLLVYLSSRLAYLIPTTLGHFCPPPPTPLPSSNPGPPKATVEKFCY